MTVQQKPGAFFSVRPEFILGLALVGLTLGVYLQTATFDFCNYDDNTYVYANPWVRGGLSADGAAWAFTSAHGANWHPLTWLSHMADVELYGLNAGSHHLTSVLLHVLNALLLFSAFLRLTGMRWESFFLAGVFAVHPLHVESVAWVAERKDVLSTFFMLLALHAYTGYAAAPNLKKYLAVLSFFICGLLAKPMVVTFPVLLLLLDYWPLGRLSGRGPSRKKLVLKVLAEKVPLLVCAALCSAITLAVQYRGGAVMSLATAPLQSRIANALVSYFSYLRDMVAPFQLSIMYVLPATIPAAAAALAGLTLLAITAAAVVLRKRQPWVTVGWLWYVLTLLPVIGFIKIGLQARADRYTYIPLIGIGLAAIWGLASLGKKVGRAAAPAGTAAGVALLIALAALSYQQARHWRNSIALYEHALAVSPDNYMARNNLAGLLVPAGRFAEAIDHCRQAIKSNPGYLLPYINLGLAYARQGETRQAIAVYRRALELKPEFPTARYYLGLVLLQQGDSAGAMEQLSLAIKYDPTFAEAYSNLGYVLLGLNRPAEAREQFLRAVQINPGMAQAYNNLGNACAMLKDFDQALVNYQRAVRLLPNSPDIHCNLGKIYSEKGMLDDAVSCFRRAVELNPASADARAGLEALTRQQVR